jgi:alkylation response protein AidB-like acyl-CoA dehydrogenase
MDLDFTAEQDLLREAVRGVCAKHASLDVVRKMEGDPLGYPEHLWTQMSETGLLGLTLPERWGGSEMSMLDAVVVYEELGRALAPSPHFVSSVMSGGVIASAGTDAQRERWLPQIAAGETVITPAWLEPDRGFGPFGVQLSASADGDGWRLSGTKRHVEFAGAADRLLVLARSGPEPEAVMLALVDPRADGVTLQAQATVASDSQCRVDFEGAHVPADSVVGAPGEAWSAWDQVMRDGIVLLAAQAVGGAVREGPVPIRQASRSLPGHRPLPLRRRHPCRRCRDARVGGSVGTLDRPAHGAPGSHVQALRMSDLP